MIMSAGKLKERQCCDGNGEFEGASDGSNNVAHAHRDLGCGVGAYLSVGEVPGLFTVLRFRKANPLF